MSISQLIKAIKNDGVVIFPTDTVLALSCLINSKHAFMKMCEIKQRDPNKPMAVLVNSIAQLEQIAYTNELAYQMLNAHAKGSITLVCKAKADYPIIANGNIGVRITTHAVPLAIINALSMPIIATSVNLSAQDAILDTKYIPDIIKQKVDFIFPGASTSNKASRVVDITSGVAVELRAP
jgi:L-threonylcarbamoyladenylate synthase